MTTDFRHTRLFDRLRTRTKFGLTALLPGLHLNKVRTIGLWAHTVLDAQPKRYFVPLIRISEVPS